MSFIGYVVRHSNESLANFIKIDSVPSDLFDADTWKRNDIKEVHVVAETIGFVANNAAQLRELMLPLQGHVSGELPRPLERRKALEKAL